MVPRPLPAGGNRSIAMRRGLLASAVALVLLAATAGARVGNPDDDFYERSPARLYATEAPNRFMHSVGLLTLQLTNMGIIGNPYNNELSAGWRGDEYLSQASIWVGARGPDFKPHVSSSIAGSRKLEFRPSRQAVDTIYPSFEGMPGGRREGFYNPDDDGDGVADEDFHNGRDDDGDGRIDEDFAALGAQMFSCEYTDNMPEALAQVPDHTPLGIKIRQRSFQWSEPSLNEFVGFDFEVINIGDQTLTDLYVGLYVDGDIGPLDAPGYFEDDLAAFTSIGTSVIHPLLTDQNLTPDGAPSTCHFVSVSLNLAYMWDSPDAFGSQFGDAPGYLGCLFLGNSPTRQDPPPSVPDPAHQYLDATLAPGLRRVTWTASEAPYPEGDPSTDDERYDLMSGTTSGSLSSGPGDYRMFISSGPWEAVPPGGKVNFEAALVVGNGFNGLVRNAAMAQAIHDGARFDQDGNRQTGADGNEYCVKVTLPRPGFIIWDDPCTFPDIEMVRFESDSCAPADYVDQDCNACTGILGREKLIKWAGLTTTPLPQVNTDPAIYRELVTNPESHIFYASPGGDRRVVLQWDNLAELRTDPFTGRNVFEGYRIWRVADWSRPTGSTGPELSDWKLLAEFRRNPRDGQGPLSPLHLRAIERRDRTQVRSLTPGGPLYHVGRYEWADTAGIVNGKVYFYAVTAFGIDRRFNPVTGASEEVVIDGLPFAEQKMLVMPSWVSGSGCGELRIVPNPYRGGADWDLLPSDCDASGTRIAFRNLPADWTRLSVHTLSGDQVFEARPGESRVLGGCEVSDDLRSGGTFYWDLVTRSGQDAVSGLYLLAVETGGQVCRKHFVVIR